MEHLIENGALAVGNATRHAIFLMDENGTVISWNTGAENIFGYSADEIIGASAAILFTEEDVSTGAHAAEIARAQELGYAEDDRWHLRADGTRFWGSGVMTPAYHQGNLEGFLKVMRDKTPEKLAHDRAHYLSQHDALTGLPNRSLFQEKLSSAIAQAKLSQCVVQVLLLDLDRFKDINDTYGHHVGDLFLKQVAKRLTGIVRATDLVARLGGDEFGIICVTADSGADGVVLAEKLVSKLCEPYLLEGNEVQSGASVGVTVYPLDSKDTGQILKNADIAMYAAKSDGRSTYRLYTEALDADAKRRRDIGRWLGSAMKDNQLMLHYQPQYCLQSLKINGIEALLRWQSCPIVDVSTEEIVAVASEIGMASALGEWVLRTACEQAKTWRAEGKTGFRMAVNISSGQLNTAVFAKLVSDVLKETELPPERLELEITEHTLMENNQANYLLFKSLKKLGIYLAVDDFGTGFSSLSSLRLFPVDTLKIDREFVRALPQNEHDAAIVSAIIGLAHSLNLKTTAEGISLPEQLEFLSALGCDNGQGFYLGVPASADKIWER